MNTNIRQLIIARKDLQMSPGKLAAQCCHASIAFLSTQLRTISQWIYDDEYQGGDGYYRVPVKIDWDTYHDWICGIFTKTICEAKNRSHLLKVVKLAEELGLKEGEDFFLIKDRCLTELEPEEVIDGVGVVLTCIGFKPLPDDIAHKISKKFQLYK